MRTGQLDPAGKAEYELPWSSPKHKPCMPTLAQADAPVWPASDKALKTGASGISGE